MFLKISRYLQTFMNISILIVGIALGIVIFLEALEIAKLSISYWKNKTSYISLVDEIIYFFLYFEFLALIVQYFKNNFHFPLRYFIYIGITAAVRLIIVDHDVSKDVLLWGLTILTLSCSLAIVNKFVKHD